MRRFLATITTVACAFLVGGGCSGGCEGTFDPLPKPIPVTQTIEGGVQVRVTKNGLKTIAQAAKSIIASVIGTNGICVPPPAPVDLGIAGDLYACERNACAGNTKGCRVDLTVGSITTTAVSADTLRADVGFSGAAKVHLRWSPPIIPDVNCDVSASVSSSRLVIDIRVGTSATTGELTLNLGNFQQVDINISRANICGLDVPSWATDAIFGLIDSTVGNWILNLVRPKIDEFIQGLLPKPLGVQGVLNIGGLLGTLIPGIESHVELRGVPGGYAQLPAEGISLGVIVGLNADRNTATRGPTDSSEPARCVPQWPGPDLAAPPALLSKTPGRQTYSLKPAGAFMGSPDPTNDLAVGVSQTVLDLAGHHIVASGALCLGVGSSFIPQLNLGTVGLLIRSLSELGTGTEPILIQVRPTQPITFDIGTGSTTSPYLTAHLKDVEIDFYALIFERYIRAFTVTFNADLGINAEFMIDAQRKPIIVPTLVGLDATKIKVVVSNSSILRETPAQIQAVFPTVLNLFIPLLTEALPDIPVPAIEGFTLGSLRLGKEMTGQDDFLAIYASLAKAGKPDEPRRATTEARVARVSTPAPERVRAYLSEEKNGALPEIELDLGGSSPDGTALEWQWNLDGGMWRPFTSDPHFVIRDLALAVQGRHFIQVRARALGDYETTDLAGVELPVVIDSAAPRLFLEQTRREGDELVLRGVDIVTAERDLMWAAGREDDLAPTTAWAPLEGRFSEGELDALSGGTGRVRIFVRDELGNLASEIIDLRSLSVSQPTAEPAGCRVGAGGSGGGGAAFLLLALVPLVLRRRRLRFLALLGLAACSTTNDLGPIQCKAHTDCTEACAAADQKSYCDPDSKMCVCMVNIKVGALGAYSDVAVGSSGTTWVSAYNSEYGDLMVASSSAMGRVPDSAWEFADGVPAGPVANKFTDVRHGINEPGDDVGRYTSIALTQAGDPMVSHYDKTNQSLRFALKAGGAWTSYVVDAGATGSKDVGRYTTLSLDAMGRPAIGYLAILKEGTALRTEVRWAQAKVATPMSQADWTTSVVEAKAAPPDPAMGMLNDIPFVNGVFINSARMADGDPVLVFYDRVNGNLKLAQWDKATSKFKAPVVVDGTAAGADVGWYPSVAATPDGKLQLAYVDANHESLIALTYPGGMPEIVDDGMRIDGTTTGGLPRPVFHRVGDNSAIVATAASRAIIYQDATAQELLMATRGATAWSHTKVAGSDTPYKGAYGFFASCALNAGNVVMSTFALNQTSYEMWIELFRQPMP